jgi:hypothetical protein
MKIYNEEKIQEIRDGKAYLKTELPTEKYIDLISYIFPKRPIDRLIGLTHYIGSDKSDGYEVKDNPNIKTEKVYNYDDLFIEDNISKKEEKRKFMLLAEKGGNPPKYIHETPSSAYWEAMRLCDLLECRVTILEIVGEIQCKQKVIIDKIPEPILSENFKNLLEQQENNDLPF